MRIKILLVGQDPASAATDGQLLRERGMMVFTVFNTQNLDELISEIQPDIVFFDPQGANATIIDTYNNFLDDIRYTGTPVIFTLSEDDVYLVTRKRTSPIVRRTNIADNIIDAVKMVLQNDKTYPRKTYRIPHHSITMPNFINRA